MCGDSVSQTERVSFFIFVIFNPPTSLVLYLGRRQPGEAWLCTVHVQRRGLCKAQ